MMVADDFQTLCRNFFTDSMTHVCSSRVPESLTKKYRNRLITAKDPYSIFKLDSRNSSYLLAFRFPEIRDCRTLWMMDVHKLNCETKDGELRKLFFGYSYRKCYTIAMDLTSELKAHCGARNYAENTQSGYYYTNNENNVIQTNSTACLLLGTSTLVICLIISFLMFAILQWKASRL
ncbi:uncharacterized protein LOC27206328 [Drosophila simulans]|uniref:Uncharacterized protein n=2 Tax=Drosophila simulans TaxID=7240 RepID=A0A0J9RIZ9_DROSI|nr:uncharacterized protein LOC27206328 [Drosophila simulans]KMY95963.1 uncharacterized protein Dsimw501_GD15451 [Drosophila simulans]